MKPKRISKFRMQVLELIIALGLLIYSALGLMGFVGDNDIVNYLMGIFLGVQIARIINAYFKVDEQEDESQDITINHLLDEEPDDATLQEMASTLARELRKRGIEL